MFTSANIKKTNDSEQQQALQLQQVKEKPIKLESDI